jgi:MoaA/NifB/PqqE/SkfB family radical SAM enzyme
MNFSVLYRGPLSSCNYGCRYCPFAKHAETPARLLRDRRALQRFADWLERESKHRWKVLFTPWGEALVRRWYRDVIARASHFAHVESVAVQTNLSGNVGWIAACRPERIALWATYHPTETEPASFVCKVQRLRTLGVRVSVGMVGVSEHLDEIKALRRLLPGDVYLWINAQQPRVRPYSPQEMAALRSIDPLFDLIARRQKSFNKFCRAGEVAFTVDGVGDMRRCHFVDEIIGNIHDAHWERALQARPCPNRFCDCFLGKAQLQADALEPFFGTTLLERLPAADFVYEPVSSEK